jgi:hypothetical protein
LAKIVLAYDWMHVWSGKRLSKFPVLPMAFRLNSDGEPNCLGRRYERLFAVNSKLIAEHPAPETLSDRCTRPMDVHAELDEVLIELFDGNRATSRLGLREPNSLSELIQNAIRSVDPSLDIILRACCFAFNVQLEC